MLQLPGLAQDLGVIQNQLAVFIVKWFHLLSLLEFAENLKTHFVIFEQMIRHRIADPRGPLARPQDQKAISSFLQEDRDVRGRVKAEVILT